MSEDLDPREVGLLPENQALLDHLVHRMAISPQTHDYLTTHWGQANLLLEAARAEGQHLAVTGQANAAGFQTEIKG